MARDSIYPPSVKPGIPQLSELPDGWVETTFGDVLKIVERPIKLEDDTEYLLVVAKRNRGGIVERDRLLGKNILTPTQFKLFTGDFLISKRQIVHGACGVVPHELDGAIVSNEYTSLQPNEYLLLEYLNYYSHTLHFQQTCFHSSVGVDVEKMIFRISEWMKHKIHLPPLEEQRKIASILGTWDKAISLVEQLIEALQARKKGLVQKLLTGDVRQSWGIAKLHELTQVILSGVDKKTREEDPLVRLCNYMDVFKNTYITNDMQFMESTASEREIEKCQLNKGDVIITKDSETAEEIAQSAVVTEYLENVICGYHLAILRPIQDKISGAFLRELIMTPDIHRQFESKANGVTRYGLTLAAIENVEIPFPSQAEQHNISEIMMLNAEAIQSLYKYVEQLQEQKHGLMQALLTGQVRV